MLYFLGTYSTHGIEIIKIDYSTNDQIEAIKLTGDPNVPAGKITFKADLSKDIVLPIEEQRLWNWNDPQKQKLEIR